MGAKIIGQNHDVITYEVNGRKRYIVEDIPVTANRRLVNSVVSIVGRKWEDVVNYLDELDSRYGHKPKMTPALENTIEHMTY